MKTFLLAGLFLLKTAFCIAQTQRLIVPALTNVEAMHGQISLPAYCIDATRIWPTYGNGLNQVYIGSDNTIITMRISNEVKTISLQTALQNNYVRLISNESSIVVVPAENIELVKLDTRGFAAGEHPEIFEYASLMNLIPSNENPDPGDWRQYQLLLHEAASREDVRTPAKKSIRVKEFADNWVKKDGRYERSANWTVTVEDDVIKIHERITSGADGPYGNHPFNKLYHDIKVIELEEMSVCVSLNPADSGITINISGKLKGAIPLKIEFDSENKFSVSAEIFADEWSAGGENIPASFVVSKSYDLNEDAGLNSEDDFYKECNLNLTAEICYPPKVSGLQVEACGKSVSLSAEGFEFKF